ncbi:hypothetical protein NS228_22160 [Methylobacterium indicum]|uniref:Flagellar basal-body protein FlbY n=1 Tax=Methylobacterium indicum TaxID=1775910 RepID=A0ABR5HDV1_9HYPH|nr:hypothetical protein [Methylobacterium indicum]KMO11284.1 hypothetical protein QR78_28885 [Methylobacterium indicum]KMO24482.1 hypothetical protein QR79_11610 [Methylobacterium indicum]KTS31768.1 hypothetical protein NS228_22160 [Methylobacterium indicum]KTS37469.1 hypothetical protein NS229_07035 [Methylobacterium indicum]KTS51420.1 hypothetical protein NS230_13820 [Methylobacterium indicum]
MSEAVRPAPVRIADPEAAARLVAETLTTMQALEALLARESDHIRVGRLAEGLAEAPQKTALAGAYLQGLQAVKANAVALARFAPEGVAALREAHGRFSDAVAANQAVLATARSVSEGLLRTLSTELNRHAEPSGYGSRQAPSPYGHRRSAPLVLSRSL